LHSNGTKEQLNENVKQAIEATLSEWTQSGFRCLGMFYKVMTKVEMKAFVKEAIWTNAVQQMAWICLCAIEDPLRLEVAESVRTCQNAGIIVRMVTGDHLETAKYIARQCGILSRKGYIRIRIHKMKKKKKKNLNHICLTGEQLRNLTDKEQREMLPHLRVLARSKPSDKEMLVNWYKTQNNDVVAVTGDGVNDALAMHKADVGLAMGIQGTDIAKKVSDIVILDDNFASIVTMVMWGRSVFDNIRKFIQFQLTVNFAALMLSLIAAFFKKFANPLTAVQLFWMDLMMDTMAALALATEPPTKALLKRNPYTRDAFLISPILWRFILGHMAYQVMTIYLFKYMYTCFFFFCHPIC
ncbi:calcium-transporting ATPase, partial [Reticulomyxa filosa]